MNARARRPQSSRLEKRRIGLRVLGAMLVGNVIWETLHLPLYTLWATGPQRYLAFVVVHCSVGDLMIATGALLAAVVLVGRGWPGRSYGRVAALMIMFGLAYTVFSEWLNVSVRGSWAYAASMPVLPMLGTGVSPLLQWMLVPAAAFAWAWTGADHKTLGGEPARTCDIVGTSPK